MKKLPLIATASLAIGMTAVVIGLVPRNEIVIGEIPPYELSITLTASDVTGEYFSKGGFNFHAINVIADNGRIVFKGLTEQGEAGTTDPRLENLTGSVPSNDGSLSGQGYSKVSITGFDGEGYGQLGINSYTSANGQGWIAYKQFTPTPNQTIVPPTTEEKPVASYVYMFGKKTLDLSVTSITYTWICGATGSDDPEEPTIDENYLGEPFVDFDNSEKDNAKYTITNGYCNGGMFLSTWSRDNVNLNNGIGELSISDSDKNYGGEVRSSIGYSFGYFGARIKAFSRPGTVQSIFTYNGGDKYEHDEIDIEILGKNTSQVQFNYYDDDVGGHEYTYELGFDASEGYHDYGFKWTEDKITWFVDFVPVYQVEANVNQWGRFYVNAWAGNSEVEGISDWLGTYVPSATPSTCYVDYISYAPLEDDNDIKLTSPLSNEVVDINEEKVSDYIKAFKKKGKAKANDYLLDINEVNTTSHTPRVSTYTTGKDISKGKPVTLSFSSSLVNKTYKVYVSTNQDRSDAKEYDPVNNKVELYNLLYNSSNPC